MKISTRTSCVVSRCFLNSRDTSSQAVSAMRFFFSATSRLLVTSLIISTHIFANVGDAARILGIFPVPMISHQVVFRRLTIELARRGHELVVFTPDPVNDSTIQNYTEIDMHHAYDLLLNFMKESGDSMWRLLGNLQEFGEHLIDDLLSNPEMQRIIAPENEEHFDVILVEYLHFEATYGLMKRFNAPMIGVVSLALLPPAHYAIGNPSACTYTPGIFDSATDDLNFWGRLNVAYRNIRWLLTNHFDNFERQDRILKKYFGPSMPFAGDLAKEVSLVLVNSHPALGYPRPNLPVVIEIGGIAFNRTLKGLDQKLQEFLDGAVDGFVYFSLGSTAKSKHLSSDKLNVLISAFANLPYKVVWKWELDHLPGKPDNVFISKWLPQQDVLAHRNIKAFVYQGGLQSTEEAINYAVPLIGMPIFNDQEFNVRKLESVGVAKRLNIRNLSKNDIVDAIVGVITEPSYKIAVLKLRELINDQPHTPIERAIWWTEYVIRHKGASHLQTRVRNMAWYERELLDILAFVIFVVLLTIFSTYKLLRRLLKKMSSISESGVCEKIKVR